MSHTGRGVLVTGASRGVGRRPRPRFAARGDRVVVHYRGARERAEAVLAGLDGEGHALLGADLADPTQVQRLAADAAAALGRVDVLVNNAAMFVDPPVAGSRRVGHPLAETPYEDWVDIWAAHPRDQPARPGQPHLVRRPAHDRRAAGGGPTGRPDRQRRLARRLPRRARRPGVRREQGRPARASAVHGGRASQPHGIGVVRLAPGSIASGHGAPVLEAPGGDAMRARARSVGSRPPQEVAAAVVALAEPRPEWASGAVIDFNGASHLR